MYRIYKDGVVIKETTDKTLTVDELGVGKHLFAVVPVIDGVEGVAQIIDVDVHQVEEAVEMVEEKSVDILEEYHTGAGWYEFPDGHKVRGKVKAKEYFDSLEKNKE